MDTDLQATDPSLQFMTSGVLDTTFYATYKKWLLYRTQDLNLYVAMVVMAIAVALISIFSRSWYVIPAGVVFIAVLYMMMMRNRTRMLNALSRALEEQYPEGMAEMSIAFGSDGLHQLNPRQRVGDMLMEVLAIHHIGDKNERMARALDIMAQVGLRPEHFYRYPHEFSGGQRQRIGLARADS